MFLFQCDFLLFAYRCGYVHPQYEARLVSDLTKPYPHCCPIIVGGDIADGNVFVIEEKIERNGKPISIFDEK